MGTNRLPLSCSTALRWLFAVMVTGVLAGCGGSDDGETLPPVGDPVSATVGNAGGSIAFTASGVQ